MANLQNYEANYSETFRMDDSNVVRANNTITITTNVFQLPYTSLVGIYGRINGVDFTNDESDNDKTLYTEGAQYTIKKLNNNDDDPVVSKMVLTLINTTAADSDTITFFIKPTGIVPEDLQYKKQLVQKEIQGFNEAVQANLAAENEKTKIDISEADDATYERAVAAAEEYANIHDQLHQNSTEAYARLQDKIKLDEAKDDATAKDNVVLSTARADAESIATEKDNELFIAAQTSWKAADVIQQNYTDRRDDQHSAADRAHTNAEIAKVKLLIDGVATGISGHSIDPETNTLTLTFTDGTSEEIHIGALFSDEVAAIEARLDAIEAKNKEQADDLVALNEIFFDKKWNTFIVPTDFVLSQLGVLLTHGNLPFILSTDGSFSSIEFKALDTAFTDAEMDELLLNRYFEFVLDEEAYKFTITERTAKSSVSINVPSIGATTIITRTYSMTVSEKGMPPHTSSQEQITLRRRNDSSDAQEARLDAVEEKNTEQDGRLTTLENAEDDVGKHTTFVAVDDGKVKLAFSDTTEIESPQFIPNPGNSAGARDLVAVVRASNGKVNLTPGTSTDVSGLLNSLSPNVPNSERVDGQHIRTNSIPADRIIGGVGTGSSTSDNNDAVDALIYDRTWQAHVKTFDSETAPVSPANVAISFSGNKVRFAFVNNLNLSAVNELVLNRRFGIEFKSGQIITWIPTSYNRTLTLDGFIINEYNATILKNGTITDGETVTMYRAYSEERQVDETRTRVFANRGLKEATTGEGGWKFAQNNRNYLDVSATSETPTAATSTNQYKGLRITVPKDRWAAMDKILITAAHANQVFMGDGAPIYKKDLTAGRRVLAGSTGSGRIKIGLTYNENVNAAGTRDTDSNQLIIEIYEGGTTGLYIGEVVFINDVGGVVIDGNADLSGYSNTEKTKEFIAEAKTELTADIAEAKTEAIGAGQNLYAIWQASHGDPTSTTNAASRPVATFGGSVSWDATNERVNIGSSSGQGTVYWENASIDFRRCVFTSEIVLGVGATSNRGRSFVFKLGSTSTNLNNGNVLEIAIDLDGFDQGAPAGSRQIYIYSRSDRRYLGNKILNTELTTNQKLEFKAVIDVEEITIYLDGVEVWHLTGADIPAMDGPYFGCVGSNIVTQVYAIAIEQLRLDLAVPRLGLPTATGLEIIGDRITLRKRGADDDIITLPSTAGFATIDNVNTQINGLRVVPVYTEIDNITSVLPLNATWQSVALKSGINILDYDELVFRFSPSQAAFGKIEYTIRASELHSATQISPAGLGGTTISENNDGSVNFTLVAIRAAFDVRTNTISLIDYGHAEPDDLNALGILGKNWVLQGA